MRSTGKCVMTYKPPRDVTKKITIELNFRTSRLNNLLFYLARKRVSKAKATKRIKIVFSFAFKT